MGIHHSPKAATNGLVFALDMGNWKSYNGRPTTNLLGDASRTLSGSDFLTYEVSGGGNNVTNNINQLNGFRADILDQREYNPPDTTNYARNMTVISGGSATTHIQFYTHPSLNMTLSYGTPYAASCWVWTDQSFTARIGARKNADPYDWYINPADWTLEVGWNFIYSEGSGYGTTVSDARFQLELGLAATGTNIRIFRPQIEAGPASPWTRVTRNGYQDVFYDLTGELPYTGTWLPLSYNGTGIYTQFTPYSSTPPLGGPSGGIINFNHSAYGINLPFGAISSADQFVTVEAMVKVDTHGNYHRFVNNNWVNNGWLLLSSGTSWIFGVGSGGVQYNTSVAHNNSTEWTHLVGIYDGQSVRLYLNGIQVDVNTGLNNHTMDTTTTSIGYYTPWGNTTGGDKYIPLVRIYDRALSDEEVQQNFNSIRGRYGI